MNERDGVLALSPEAGAWERLGEAALRRPALRRGRHRRRAARGARACRPTSGPTAPPACARSPRPARPPTGSPTSSPPPDARVRQASERQERERALGAVDDEVGACASERARSLRRAHGDLDRGDAPLGEAVEGVEGREVADVVADEAHRLQPVGSAPHDGALVDGDGRVQLDRHLGGAQVQPGAGRRRVGPRDRGVLGSGRGRKWSVSDRPLCSTSTPVGAELGIARRRRRRRPGATAPASARARRSPSMRDLEPVEAVAARLRRAGGRRGTTPGGPTRRPRDRVAPVRREQHRVDARQRPSVGGDRHDRRQGAVEVHEHARSLRARAGGRRGRPPSRPLGPSGRGTVARCSAARSLRWLACSPASALLLGCRPDTVHLGFDPETGPPTATATRSSHHHRRGGRARRRAR